ncbi:MAG: DUF4252 domain-containing protein [Saprospiraceae bacterium]|nr:DUF4252 domain-containing protein [Saprospiraceae bacterium]MCZ2337586.1 DUF4252 domain-containing protein [Chitinophagales bacterium]
MRHIFSFIILLFTTLTYSQSDAIERYFKDYQQNQGFTSVYVSPKMFQMMAKNDDGTEDKEFISVVKDLKGLRILSTTQNAMNVYNEVNSRLSNKGFEELVSFRDKGSNVRFLTKESNHAISELLLIAGSKTDFVFMSFVGNIDLSKISKLSKKLNFSGAEHLDRVNRK